MREFEVNCVTRLSRSGGHEQLTHVGHIANHWRLTRESVIRRVESGAEAYYTLDKASGGRRYIAVVREAGHAPYLRTQHAGGWTDHLLSLPECGRTCELVG